MATRIYKGPPVYGSAADTDASSPNTGTNYRNADLTDASITAGLRGFNTRSSSANENEYLFRLSTLVDLIERTGILGWNAETVYVTGSVVVANDKKIYQAVQGSTAVDPTTDPGTTWVDYITANSASVSDASESVKGIIEIATNAEAAAGNDDTKAITPAKLAAVISSEVVNASKTERGIIQIATDAEAVAAVDDTKALTPAMLQAYINANPISPADATETVKGIVKLATAQQLINLDDDTTAITPKKIGDRLLNARKIRIGENAGEIEKESYNIAIGYNAGQTEQYSSAIAIGWESGRTEQHSSAIAIGWQSGHNNQGSKSIAIGMFAGKTNQAEESICIGNNSNASSEKEIHIGQSSSSVFIGDGNVQAVSDMRDKSNIADSNLGLDFIMQLQPKSWTANTRDFLEPNDDSKRTKGSRPHYGFVAQDVKQAMDSLGVDFAGYCELVHAATPAHKERVKDRLTLRYQEFIGPMVKAMQEQQAMIDELKKEVQALKGGKDV